MVYWRKTYERNYAKGIAGSILIHLFLLILLIIPKCEEPVMHERIYIHTNDVIVFQNALDAKDIIGDGLGIGGSSGLGSNPNAQATNNTQALFANPVASSTPDEIDFGMLTNLNKPDSTSREGFGSSEGSGYGSGSGGGKGDGIGSGTGTGKVYQSLPFAPRQVLEVLPDNTNETKGYIILALRIGTDGKVQEHKVLMNSMNDSALLNKVLEAANKSRWQSVKMEGEKVEYWIEKTYRFD
ncbi:MAG: energy transducer TonB [Ignavibacteriales bacterium]|nr:energy transducer TonB [Ignavibacteriales bacterium]